MTFDLILSDVRVPNFLEFEALELAKAKRPDVPFIYISGSMNDEHLSRAMKLGAADYVLKDRPARLESIVRKLGNGTVWPLNFNKREDRNPACLKRKLC